MIEAMTISLIFLTALGSALMAGTFFAFSNFVMPALAKLPDEQAISAMQSVNRVVLNPLFLTLFMGTAAVAVVLALLVLPDIRALPSMLVLAAVLCYVVGTFGVTVVFNVPLNNALDAVSATSADGAALWQRYLRDWVFWNTVRTILPALGVMLLMASLIAKG